MRTAYKVRVYPATEQAAQSGRTFGCIRLVWNKTLADRHAAYHQRGEKTSYKATDAALTGWKKTAYLAFLSEVSSVPLQQTLRHEANAFNNFFAGRAKYPRFKNRNSRQSAHYTRSAFRFKDGQLWLAKHERPLEFVWSWPGIDPQELNPTMVVVSRESDGRWYATFAVDTDEAATAAPTDRAVGVDLGVKDFAVLSTGEAIANPRHLGRKARNLARYQRRMARCVKGSANRRKAKTRVAVAHRKVRHARNDFLHKTSTRLVRDHDVIAVEDLNVTGMLKNRKLGRVISDVGWGEFRRQLEYKATRAGKLVAVIDRWYPSSKTCSHCGHLLSKLKLSTRRWTCPGCRTRHDRDINAAKNILAAGLAATQDHRVLSDACGGEVRPWRETARHTPVKQERPHREEAPQGVGV